MFISGGTTSSFMCCLPTFVFVTLQNTSLTIENSMFLFAWNACQDVEIWIFFCFFVFGVARHNNFGNFFWFNHQIVQKMKFSFIYLHNDLFIYTIYWFKESSQGLLTFVQKIWTDYSSFLLNNIGNCWSNDQRYRFSIAQILLPLSQMSLEFSIYCLPFYFG